MANKEEFVKALRELRKNEKRKFLQSADIIINLKNFDIKRESINFVANLPFKFREVKAAAFLNNNSKIVDTITPSEFERYKGKLIKKLVKRHDFFIANSSLMPSIATNFGKYLGQAGKMPSPQLGIIAKEDDSSIEEVLKKAEKAIRIKAKEPSLKLAIGNEGMEDDEIAENAIAVYNSVLDALPNKKESIKNVLIKFTMSKPVKIQI